MEPILLVKICKDWRTCIKECSDTATKLSELELPIIAFTNGIFNTFVDKQQYRLRFYPATSEEMGLLGSEFWILDGSAHTLWFDLNFKGSKCKGKATLNPIVLHSNNFDY